MCRKRAQKRRHVPACRLISGNGLTREEALYLLNRGAVVELDGKEYEMFFSDLLVSHEDG